MADQDDVGYSAGDHVRIAQAIPLDLTAGAAAATAVAEKMAS